MDWITIAVSVASCAAAVFTDIRWGRVPNYITFLVMLFGLVYAYTVISIPSGIERSLLLLVLFVIGVFGLMGMGDLKLLMTIGVLNGTLCLLLTTALGAVLLLAHQWLRNRRETITDVKAGLLSLLYGRFDGGLGTGRKVKFAPYLLLGLIGGILICGR